jgi:hypothetical protein
MKKRLFGMAGALAALLAFTVLAGCEGMHKLTEWRITFSVGEGSGTPPADQYVEDGTPYTLPGQGDMIAPEGKPFSGWAIQDSTHTIYREGQSSTAYDNWNYIAQWGAVTIIFSAGEGSGTPPASQSTAGRQTIILPEQGDMTAPEGRVFSGWRHDYDNSTYTYRAGSEYTVPLIDGPKTITFTAQWGTGITLTFSTGTGSGTPPANQTVAQGVAFTLPGKGSMIAPPGTAFSGWSSEGSFYTAGASYTPGSNSGTRTFTAQWKPQGVYVGIISFAGTATDLTPKDYLQESTLYYLDSTWNNSPTSLKSRLDRYMHTTGSGTALYYAVHKALANLTATEPVFADATIQSVNLITFTDGLDNGSFGASRDNPIEGKSEVQSSEYAEYIKEQIANRTIAGTPVTAYSIGVDTVVDSGALDTALSNIASPGNSYTLANVSELQGKLTDIANTIDVRSESIFVMQTPLNDPGTVVRMTFDVSGANPTPAEAAASSSWLEGMLAYSNGKYSLTNIQHSSGISFTNGASIDGIEVGGMVSFTFNSFQGCDPQPATTKQWTKPSSASTSWQINPEYSAAGSTALSMDTMLVYLVLDATLDTTQIDTIRTAVTNFITALYNRTTAGN